MASSSQGSGSSMELSEMMNHFVGMEEELSKYLLSTVLHNTEKLSSSSSIELQHLDDGKFEKAMRWVILRGMQKPYSGVVLSERKTSWWFGTSVPHCFLVGDALDWMTRWTEQTMQKTNIKNDSSNSSNVKQVVELMGRLVIDWGWIEPLVAEEDKDLQQFNEKNKSLWFRMSKSVKPRLILVGGGMSGYKVAKGLGDDLFEIILIDKEGTMDLVPIYPTLISDKNNIYHIAIDHRRTLSSTKVTCIKGVVTCASQSGVIFETLEAQVANLEVTKLANDENTNNTSITSSTMNPPRTTTHRYFMKFDYLILAPGCTCWNNFPISSELNQIKFVNPYDANSLVASHEFIENLPESEKAHEICVLGGGYVACEVAGFLAEKYKNKKITIIQRSNMLMKPSQDAHHAVMDIFKTQLTNVKVMLNSEIISQSSPTSFTIRTRKENDTNVETQVNCSVCFVCTGMKPQTEFLKDFFSKSLDSKGYICVNSHMQVVFNNENQELDTNNHSTHQHHCYNNILAIGDATNVKETKLASHAHKHGKTASAVVSQLSQSLPESQLSTYSPRGYERPQTVIIGPNNGLWIKGSSLLLNSSVVAYLKERGQAMKGRAMSARGNPEPVAEQEENKISK